MSPGMSAIRPMTTSAANANPAGTIVPPTGLSPGSTPVRSSTPNTTSAIRYTEYVSTRKATIRHADRRRGMPALRSAQ